MSIISYYNLKYFNSPLGTAFLITITVVILIMIIVGIRIAVKSRTPKKLIKANKINIIIKNKKLILKILVIIAIIAAGILSFLYFDEYINDETEYLSKKIHEDKIYSINCQGGACKLNEMNCDENKSYNIDQQHFDNQKEYKTFYEVWYRHSSFISCTQLLCFDAPCNPECKENKGVTVAKIKAATNQSCEKDSDCILIDTSKSINCNYKNGVMCGVKINLIAVNKNQYQAYKDKYNCSGNCQTTQSCTEQEYKAHCDVHTHKCSVLLTKK